MPATGADGKPTGDIATDLVELGRVLDEVANPVSGLGMPRRHQSPEEQADCMARIAALEAALDQSIQKDHHATLRRAIGVRHTECVPPDLLRPLAVVVQRQLGVGCHSLGVASVAHCAGLGTSHGMIEARRGIRILVARGALAFADGDGGDGELRLAPRVVRALSGGLDLVWTTESLKRDLARGSTDQQVQDLQRRAALDALRNEASAKALPAEPSAPDSTLKTQASAKAICAALSKTVISLPGPVRRFSTQMAMHLARLSIFKAGRRPSVGPVVTLILGPSGSGKTHMATEFACNFGLPYSIADMSGITQSAYVGLSLEDCFSPLLAGKRTPEEASRGIVVMDEFDKAFVKSGTHGNVDPSGGGLQAEILRPLDGCLMPIGGRRANDAPRGTLDTSQMAFVLCGAFSGLKEMVKELGKQRSGLGFSGGGATSSHPDLRAGLVRYGFLEQVVNRIGSIISLPEPSIRQLYEIATHENGLVARQNKFLETFGISISPTAAAVTEIAAWARETKGYSRAMKSLLSALSEDAVFEGRAGEIVVGKSEVKAAIESLRSGEALG